jgi:hypothetical protein
VVADTVVADTVVGAVTRRLREGYEGTNVAWVVLLCASALVGIFLIVGSVSLYVDNRDRAAHGVRTQGQVVEADAVGSDKVVYTVGGTVYEVPVGGTVYEVPGWPEVGDRLPGEAVTVVYDPRDPANSNLEDDSVAWHLHWVLLGLRRCCCPCLFRRRQRPGRRSDRAVVIRPHGLYFRARAGDLRARAAQRGNPVFEAASAAQRSTHGHSDVLEAWRTHADS